MERAWIIGNLAGAAGPPGASACAPAATGTVIMPLNSRSTGSTQIGSPACKTACTSPHRQLIPKPMARRCWLAPRAVGPPGALVAILMPPMRQKPAHVSYIVFVWTERSASETCSDCGHLGLLFAPKSRFLKGSSGEPRSLVGRAVRRGDRGEAFVGTEIKKMGRHRQGGRHPAGIASAPVSRQSPGRRARSPCAGSARWRQVCSP